MQNGLLGSAIVRIENEIQMEVEKYPAGKFLPRPRGHDLPLKFEPVSDKTIKTSSEWLKEFGLKAKKLNLYQILAPNAYAPIEDFIPILKKTVQSTVHEVSFFQRTGKKKGLLKAKIEESDGTVHVARRNDKKLTRGLCGLIWLSETAG
jgi:hypothetical protein